MKSYRQFISESVNIAGDFNGNLYINDSKESEQEQIGEEYFADIIWMGSIYRMKLEQQKSLRLPTTQELAEQLQPEYPGAIVQRIYPVEVKPTVKISDVKRYHPAKLDWV
jgi:hypothetical protein